jgi:hypothetical protein
MALKGDSSDFLPAGCVGVKQNNTAVLFSARSKTVAEHCEWWHRYYASISAMHFFFIAMCEGCNFLFLLKVSRIGVLV